ncbi:MAG: DinB family protein [Blastocatellia bacterium]|nr:DinB family protein [Blastocatellia bacterium]
MSLSEAIAAELKHEAAITRRLLERVPEEALGWKPHEKSMTLSMLAGHVAELPDWFSAIVKQDELDFATMDYKPLEPTKTSELLEAFDKNVASALDVLQGQTDEFLSTSWRLRDGERIFFEMPRSAVIRSMTMNHLIHHRGQLSVYLRMKDVPIPSIYGPSADEQV